MLPPGLTTNKCLVMDGLQLLEQIPDTSIPAAFFDPQYRGLLDRMDYGNEGKERGQGRVSLRQMDANTIRAFINNIDRVLLPSGHLFLWLDKFHVCEGFKQWLKGSQLAIVDLITWDKGQFGMGYRTRRQCEYLIVLQKLPRRAKGVWQVHNLPDVWQERVASQGRIHPKPVGLQARLIEAVTNEGDIVIDPAAGSFSVFAACKQTQRTFLGCDING